MKPYFYIIEHKPTKKLYVGSQYGKYSDSKNLLVEYFTSSYEVKKLIQTDGINSFKIIEIEERIDAREYEQQYLQEKYKNLGRELFLSTYLNRNISPGILLTKEIIEKANKKRKISNSIAAKKMIEEGRHNFQLYPAHKNETWRKKTSNRMMGNDYGKFRKMTLELRKKIGNGAKGNRNVRGTKWWYNPITKEKRRCLDKPGNEWLNKCPVNIGKKDEQTT